MKLWFVSIKVLVSVNRTLMELKVGKTFLIKFKHLTVNRTLMELKSVSGKMNRRALRSVNRTLMELKYAHNGVICRVRRIC